LFYFQSESLKNIKYAKALFLLKLNILAFVLLKTPYQSKILKNHKAI